MGNDDADIRPGAPSYLAARILSKHFFKLTPRTLDDTMRALHFAKIGANRYPFLTALASQSHYLNPLSAPLFLTNTPTSHFAKHHVRPDDAAAARFAYVGAMMGNTNCMRNLLEMLILERADLGELMRTVPLDVVFPGGEEEDEEPELPLIINTRLFREEDLDPKPPHGQQSPDYREHRILSPPTHLRPPVHLAEKWTEMPWGERRLETLRWCQRASGVGMMQEMEGMYSPILLLRDLVEDVQAGGWGRVKFLEWVFIAV